MKRWAARAERRPVIIPTWAFLLTSQVCAPFSPLLLHRACASVYCLWFQLPVQLKACESRSQQQNEHVYPYRAYTQRSFPDLECTSPLHFGWNEREWWRTGFENLRNDDRDKPDITGFSCLFTCLCVALPSIDVDMWVLVPVCWYLRMSEVVYFRIW